MFRNFVSILALCAASLTAWGQEFPSGVNTMIFPPPAQAFNEIKAYLTLTDPQLEQLRQVLSDRDKAQQEFYRQLGEKQRTLQQLLESGSTDANQIGRLNIEIFNLSKNGFSNDSQYRQRALSILSQAQRAKLPALEEALKIAPTAYQGVHLLLVTQPETRPSPPVIMGTPEPAIRP